MSSASVAMGSTARAGRGSAAAARPPTAGSVAVRPAARPVPAQPAAPQQPAVPQQPGAARPGVRLTARGRVVAVLAVVLAGLVLGLALRQGPGVAGVAGERVTPGAAYDWVVVEPGQTLWQIAEAAAPGTDPRVTIMRIQDLNGLPDAAVSAGQRIALPRSR